MWTSGPEFGFPARIERPPFSEKIARPMFIRLCLGLALAGALALPAFSQARKNQRQSNAELLKLTAVGTQEIEIRSGMSLDLNCELLGQARVAIIRAPQNGTVLEQQRDRFPNFGNANPRRICNDKRTKATFAIYRANPGFQGVDRFRFAIVYYNGESNIYDVEMTVWR